MANCITKISLKNTYLGAKKEQYDIEPKNEYNIDKKGFVIGILQGRKRVFNKIMYQ